MMSKIINFQKKQDIQPEEGENLKWILDAIDNQIANPKPESEFGPSVVTSFCKKWRDVLQPLKMLPTSPTAASTTNSSNPSKTNQKKNA